MKRPLISIVLPTFNGAKFIRDSIESCLKQTFRDLELIIVNDCSTDETASILEEYASDSRVRIVSNEVNKKLPLSLNTGFDLAKGTYFTWTSDDNIYAPTALEYMVKVLNNSDVDLVYCDYTIIDDEGQPVGVRRFGNIHDSFTKWLGCGACFLYKKQVHVENKGYNPAAFLIEDYDFFVRAFIKFKFLYLPTHDQYYYREHKDSLTSTYSDTINDISKIFLERNLDALVQKLSATECGLLYRKLAAYYSIQKSNKNKYKYYLNKLRNISIKQTSITILYVFVKKLSDSFAIGFAGLFFLMKSLLIKDRF